MCAQRPAGAGSDAGDMLPAQVRFVSVEELRREFFTSSTVPSDFK
jgi:hypothetical protein